MNNAQLAGELERLGVPFLQRAAHPALPVSMDPVDLVGGLALSDEARVRLAIIPLLILHPEYATAARSASRKLVSDARILLQCYYTAAMLLQRKYADQLAALSAPRPALPDLFSAPLGVPVIGDSEMRLHALAARQAALSGDPINWQGTYEHAARVLLRRLELDTVWTI